MGVEPPVAVLSQRHLTISLAGVEGVEPPVAVLETAGLPLTDTPSTTFRANPSLGLRVNP